MDLAPRARERLRQDRPDGAIVVGDKDGPVQSAFSFKSFYRVLRGNWERY